MPSLALLLLLALLALSHAQPARTRCLRQPRLICNLLPTAGSRARGSVTFAPAWRPSSPGRHGKCVVRIRATVTNLKRGAHGFHIHTYGDTSLPDGTSAGGHFSNPRGKAIPHALPSGRPRHWGDFGNVVANRRGVARYTRVDRVVTLRGIRGRGVIVHALPDMGHESQPTGGAGGRVAACVIGFANPDV